MIPEQHHPIGPSGASRWLACPGSVGLAAINNAKDKGSPDALIGTGAHQVFEEAQLLGESADSFKGKTILGVEVDNKMVHGVNIALDYVYGLEHKYPQADAYTERTVPIHNVYKDLFGTIDYTLYDKKRKLLVVADYKNGYTPVEVEGNPQLMLYALGAISELPANAVKTVMLVILQPNGQHPAGPIREHTVTISELLAFEETARETAELIMDRPEEAAKQLNPGESQCRWCRALDYCYSAAAHALEVCRAEFDDETGDIEMPEVETLDNDDLALIMGELGFMETWIKAIKARTMNELETGHDVPGYKLVEGRSIRKWTDPEAAEEYLYDQGIDEDEFAPRKLCSPAAAEKLPGIDKKELSGLWTKPQGKPAVVPESDPRPALQYAEDFDVLD